MKRINPSVLVAIVAFGALGLAIGSKSKSASTAAGLKAPPQPQPGPGLQPITGIGYPADEGTGDVSTVPQGKLIPITLAKSAGA